MQPKRQTVEQRRQAVRDECKRRGIRIMPSGKAALRLFGTGVDVLVSDLVFVDLRSLERVTD